MARIRTIKPSFWGSPTIAPLSRDARLLAIGLMSYADDDGRFLAATNALNGYVFPNDARRCGHTSMSGFYKALRRAGGTEFLEFVAARGIEEARWMRVMAS